MKILGFQKDFFDQMIYTYGIDESLRLDRTVFRQGNKQSHFKNGEWINPESDKYPFIDEMRSLNEYYSRKDFFKDLPYNWRWQYIEDCGELNFHKIVNILRNNHQTSPYIQKVFYFDGYLYLLYAREEVSGTGLDFNGQPYNKHFPLNAQTVANEYKGKFKLLTFESGKVVKIKAHQKIIDVSKKFLVPYFCLDEDFFFPFLSIEEREKYFDVTEVYQTIENFLVNGTLEEMQQQSNENKITAHGFDLKSSFRKEKGE